MRSLLVLLVSLALFTPLSSANAPVAVEAVFGANASAGSAALDAVNYVHDDCVGPGLPGTAPLHGAHTVNVPGFVIDPARSVSVNVLALSVFGAGICPTVLGGPVLPQDFTGRLRLVGVCRGTLNPGTVFFDFTFDFVGGLRTGQAATGSSCVGYLNTAFSLDVTLTLSQTTFAGLPLGPLGGVRHTISQA